MIKDNQKDNRSYNINKNTRKNILNDNKENKNVTPGSKSKINKVFENLKNKDQKGFIAFITCGFPDINNYMKLTQVLEKNGADIIEIGIPFSDPLADGAVIQSTSKIALDNGVNTDVVFNSIKKIRDKSSIPLVLLTYFNTVYKYGIDNFLNNASNAGADGLIIPDLPLEEFYNYKNYFQNSALDNILLASLNSSTERLKKISILTQGFLYCVSVKGVTGVRNNIDSEVIEFLKRLKEITKVPLALGFGISTAEQVSKVKKYCDAVIMGSKILSILLQAGDFNKGLEIVSKLVYEINLTLKN